METTTPAQERPTFTPVERANDADKLLAAIEAAMKLGNACLMAEVERLKGCVTFS